MKIKLLKDEVVNGSIEFKDAVVDAPAEDASKLIAAGAAVSAETKSPPVFAPASKKGNSVSG